MNPISRLFGHLLGCKAATRLISHLQERRLSGLERLRLQWHLAACDACTRFDQQVVFLREAMRRLRI
jgi:Putative zinc-finger